MGKGKEPTIPTLQHTMTSSGPETKNMGAAINGKVVWLVIKFGKGVVGNLKILKMNDTYKFS